MPFEVPHCLIFFLVVLISLIIAWKFSVYFPLSLFYFVSAHFYFVSAQKSLMFMIIQQHLILQQCYNLSCFPAILVGHWEGGKIDLFILQP